ncbi:MAG: hypothetical protein SGILL_001495 [Bacillariaceae sp.]
MMNYFIENHLKDTIVATETMTKYKGHTAVHLTHLLPAAIWSAAIPFQLHRGFRKEHPVLHRRVGYAFFCCSFLVAMGIVIIVQRDLSFEKLFDDLPPLKSSTEPVMYFMALYFAVSAGHSLRLARARRFFDHQLWVIRHVAAGLWVAFQRLLLIMVYSRVYPPPVARETQRQSFITASYLGILISCGCGEFAIYLLKQERAAKLQPKKTV